MIDLCSDKSRCCGCSACKAICPKVAISIEKDEYGYLYPKIDRKKCIECYLCERVCAFKKKNISGKKPIKSYIGINKNSQDLFRSASGGAFSAIAKYVLDKNGVVIGCAWNNELMPEHIVIDSYQNLYKLQGSKYVQSNIESIFKETKQLLENNKKVFFTGTPCQVDALKEYLGKDYDQLLTADLICHGVPNVDFFNSYKKWFQNRNRCKILEVNFRDKEKLGWSSVGSITIKKDNKVRKHTILYTEDPYYYLFEYGFILRESCYSCKYACSDRKGDLTLGDFWGIQKYYPDLDRTKGVSALLVNTYKGEKVIEQMEDYMDIIPTKYKYIEENNEKLRRPSSKPQNREVWIKYWKTGGFDLVAREFYRQKWKMIIVSKVRRHIPKRLKELVKKIIDYSF